MIVRDSEEDLRQWVAERAAAFARYTAYEKSAREAEQRLRDVAESERPDAIEALARACIVRDTNTPRAIEFDEAQWERAIDLGLATREIAVEMVEALCTYDARPWLDRQARADVAPVLDGEDTWIWSDRMLLGSLAVLRNIAALAAAKRIQRWIDESGADDNLIPLRRWAVAWLRGEPDELFAIDAQLFEWRDALLTGRDGRDGPYVDRRASCSERLLEIREIAGATRWFERIAREPAQCLIGTTVLARGAPASLGRAMRNATSPEQFAALEAAVFEALNNRDATTFEWLDFAAWASPANAEKARERAVQSFEERGGFIDAVRLGASHQRRIAAAMVERWSSWVETVEVFTAESLAGSTRESLCAWLDSLPASDAAAAKIVWPLIARIAERAQFTTESSFRFSIARLVQRCARHGLQAAIELREAWRTTGHSGWRECLDAERETIHSSALLASLARVPFEARKAFVQRLDDAGVFEVSPGVRTRGGEAERGFVPWLLAQRQDVLNSWVCSNGADRLISPDEWWSVLDRWASGGFAMDSIGPFPEDGREGEFAAWVDSERSWTRSRWSWTRDETLRWIESGAPQTERHWLFEPGVTALLVRFRGDPSGRLALGQLFSALVERTSNMEELPVREQAAINRLLEFSSSDGQRAMAGAAWRRGDDALESNELLEERVAAIARGVEELRQQPPPGPEPAWPSFDERFNVWRRSRPRPEVEFRGWMLAALPAERVLELASWGVDTVCAIAAQNPR